MAVPFVDLYAQYLSIREEIDNAISGAIRDSAFIGGKAVKKFEGEFSAYLGVDHVIGCANGTDSLEILLKVFNIGKDDEVIVPASSWISTSECVGSVGAKPVFVDIESKYYTIDPSLIEEKITSKTKVIIPVHLYGHPADMPAIMAIAKKYNLIVIEDCAQAHGAAINGVKTGTFGDAASFSFYPGKNLGAYGDAGCMATNNQAIAEAARAISNHGQQGKHNHIMEGRNSRLDAMQAAILSAKLRHLEKWTNLRIEHAKTYARLLEGTPFVLPKEKEGYRHVFHLYVIQASERKKLQDKLTVAGIETAIHYPVALPFLECYSPYAFKSTDFPVAHYAQSKILSIPMFAELRQDQLEMVANALTSHAG